MLLNSMELMKLEDLMFIRGPGFFCPHLPNLRGSRVAKLQGHRQAASLAPFQQHAQCPTADLPLPPLLVLHVFPSHDVAGLFLKEEILR